MYAWSKVTTEKDMNSNIKMLAIIVVIPGEIYIEIATDYNTVTLWRHEVHIIAICIVRIGGNIISWLVTAGERQSAQKHSEHDIVLILV